MVFSLSSFPFVFFVPNTMEDVHVFEGVAYVPIKFIWDKQHDWVSAGWLSKQMAHMEMGSQIETYDYLFRKGECSDALWAEWDVYWKLLQLRPQQISVFWTGGRVCQRPSPYCMPWHAMHWQCLPLHATWSVASRP